MSGKIVITGSNRGIGRSIAEKMASEKYGIIMVDYDNAVLDSAKSLNSRYGNVEGIKCDVSSYDACVEAFSTIDKKEIYGIVNNAGINRDALFKNMSFDQWDAVIKTDLYRRFASGQNNLMLDYCMSYDIVHDWNGLEVLLGK